MKHNRIEPKVSYLSYPDFDADPHPALSTSVRAHLRDLHLKYRDFRNSKNPPILHRKETLVAPDYPGRDVFARLTTNEEALGLYESVTGIGTKLRWEALLEEKGVQIQGHDVLPRNTPTPSHPHGGAGRTLGDARADSPVQN